MILRRALNRKIPYSTWRWWHKLSGPVFLILHWLSIKSPIAIDDPAGIWLAVIATLGAAAAAYKLLLFPALSSHAEYRVTAVSGDATAVHLGLAPVKQTIQFTPGQFAFISAKQDGLREPHPFTIASANDSKGSVHFVRDFPPIEALAEMARERGLELVPVPTGPASPEFITRFTDIVHAAGADAVEISFCGPKGLSKAVRSLMSEIGIPMSNLRSEYFEVQVREPGSMNTGCAKSLRGISDQAKCVGCAENWLICDSQLRTCNSKRLPGRHPVGARSGNPHDVPASAAPLQ